MTHPPATVIFHHFTRHRLAITSAPDANSRRPTTIQGKHSDTVGQFKVDKSVSSTVDKTDQVIKIERCYLVNPDDKHQRGGFN